MYKVLFAEDVYLYLSLYFKNFRKYYEALYEDSWIWSESQIIDWFILESKQRRKEIINFLSSSLSWESIFGSKFDNTIILKWRSKYIFVSWVENKNKRERFIDYIEIR